MGKFVDETGNRHGRWTVLGHAKDHPKKGKAYWRCRCDCGNVRVVAGPNLRNGGSKSCGCLRRERASEVNTIDLTGSSYGKLTALRRVENDRHGASRWLCKCDCGNEVTVGSHNLRRGKTKSCGCLRTLPRGIAAFNTLVGSMKYAAEIRDLEWQLTNKQVRYLTKQPCYYCGAEPAQVSGGGATNGVYIYNGIDRVDNRKGYTTNNVVPCCSTCNRMKLAMTLEEFKSQVVRIHEHLVMGTS